MKCPECQFDNREGAKFCKKCGAKLELTCPLCNTLQTPDSLFCDKCGSDLIKPAEAPIVNYSEPQSYTPKFLADKILTTRSSIEGERKLVTVLFADVANYTAMSEMLDPEEVHQIMDGCFKILIDEIHRFEGTINQFTGDGIMAIFGAPVAHEDHAQRACYSALSIQKAIGEYAEWLKKDSGIEFNMRIGINSGPVVVGSIGNDLRMDYTAIGDTTNLAARMESEAQTGCILVSNNTYKTAKDYFDFRSIGHIEIKGKKQQQKTYELIKTGEAETRIKVSVAKGLTKFVGRKNSMAALNEPFEKMLNGAGQVVGVVGEAGVGKSRLLFEFIKKLQKEEVTYLEGRCLQYGGSILYMPILAILKNYLDIKEDDREFIVKKKIKEKISALDEKLTGVIAPLQDLLSLNVEDEEYLNLVPKEKREKIFEALRDVFVTLSQSKPLVLAVEDLHWIDKTSEELLDYLIGWIANERIMLILLYRPEYAHQWSSKSYYTKNGLTQLGTASSRKLVQAILEEGEIVPELEQLLLNRSSGNPLFLEELICSLLENGTIQKKGRKYVLDTKGSDIQVPDTIQDIIAARMDRLEENLKRTMQVASVIGREFAFRILRAVSGMREEIKSYLLNLQGLEFIYEKSLFPELEYIFKHSFTQEVAYNSLLLARKKIIHEQIGNAIQELYPYRLEEFYEMLAYHYSKSDNLEKAYQYLKLSGQKAIRSYSFFEAFNFYKEALKFLNQISTTEQTIEEQINIRLLLSDCMYPLGYPEDSIKVLEDGKKLSEEIRDRRSMADFHRKIGYYYGSKGKHLLAIRYLEDSLQEIKKIHDFDLTAQVTTELCISYARAGQFFKVVVIAPSTLKLIKCKKEEYELFDMTAISYSRLLSIYGLSLGMLGNFSEGKTYLEKSLFAATEINDLLILAACEWHYGYCLVFKGDLKLAIEHFQKSIKYGEKAKWLWFTGWAHSLLGYAYYLFGDPDTAIKHAEKGLRLQRSTEVDAFFSIPNWVLSEIYLDLGNQKNALSHIQESLQLSEKNNERAFEGLSWITLGRVLKKTNPQQIEKAKEFILKGIKIVEKLKLRPYSAIGYLRMGELYSDTEQRRKAMENLKKAKEMFQEMAMDYWLARSKTFLAIL